MARSGWRKPESDVRLSVHVSVGVLSRVFPLWRVEEAVEAAGRRERRHRALPASVVTYFAVALGLYAEESYEDIMERLTEGLSWASGWEERYRMPSKSAIFQARDRLGAEPVKRLFEAAAKPLGAAGDSEVFLAGRRMVAIDGTGLDVADTAANDEYFGRPSSSRGQQAAFPMAHLLALAECGTHAIFAARIGAWSDSERTLAAGLYQELDSSMLLIADRGFFSYTAWRQASGTGAELLWRIRTDKAAPKPQFLEELADGSWLAHLQQTHSAAARRAEPLLVRVIDHQIDDGRQNPETYRLFTTITDPAEATAAQLAEAYTQRWEIESAFDELKTHQRGPKAMLRSKSLALVEQEIWGHLCCHYAIRAIMQAGAEYGGRDPDRVSFTASLRSIRSTLAQAGDFPPHPSSEQPRFLALLRRILHRLNPERRRRSNPRVVKRKISGWLLKRPKHAHWPHPDRDPPAYMIQDRN